MGEVGMHEKHTGERHVRSPNHQSNGARRFGNGLRNIRDRAKKLSNAVGYESRDAPRAPSKAEQS
ncbi:MAG TPA: hypothetical protein EYQ11_00805 [Candidatus Poseidoniales archaeon]|jgi:hypothetical protein|nr:MAG: hypothetical protein CXT66_02495 [Euryarchaeota archaeon]HIG33408.1 hypothetical protein [Candidatus Poseidoniales archaeon]HIL67228.1 hypothetical protein [Candidatus Poseidoniales archaeon]